MYIPNAETMFKLMRACIAVRTPKELVFYEETDIIQRYTEEEDTPPELLDS